MMNVHVIMNVSVMMNVHVMMDGNVNENGNENVKVKYENYETLKFEYFQKI